MPRQLRIQYPGALYHVTARGDRREDIVHDDGDREMLLATLAEACKKTGWEVLAVGAAPGSGAVWREVPCKKGSVIDS